MRGRLDRSGESGAALILVVVTLPLLVVMLTFVVEIGNWWVHKRNLQIKADAAALAGATRYKFPNCDDTLIRNTVLQYSGVGNGVDTTYNPPLKQTQENEVATGEDHLHMRLNAPSPFERTEILDPELIGEPGPCAAKMVDVKMTEDELPFFFKPFAAVAGAPLALAELFGYERPNWIKYIDAQARVELKRKVSSAGMLPIGVEDINPKRVHVWLFDQDNPSQILGEAELYRKGVSGGLYHYDNSIGNGAGTPITFNVTHGRIGVGMALSGSNSITCGQPLVLCYGLPGQGYGTEGVTRIRGYTTSGNQHRLEEVLLAPPASCPLPDRGYFSTSCATQNIEVRLVGPDPALATVQAEIEGLNQKRTLTHDATTGTWKGTVPVQPLGAGGRDITISYEQKSGTVGTLACTSGNANPCKLTSTNAHSTFSGARPLSGPVKGIEVSATPIGLGEVTDGNNVGRCAVGTVGCETAFTVSVFVGGRLELADPNDPPISLRVFGGSQNQSLDCDPAVQGLDNEIAAGCAPQYHINEGQTCPQPSMVGTPPPWHCVAIQTGTNANAPARGLNTRIYGDPSPGPVCPTEHANHWPDWQEGDRRIVPVFLVPFGSFDGAGTGTVPVIDFATFYVTGWTSNGNGFQNPCKDEGDAFVPGTEGDSGAISGHFMTYVSPNTEETSDEACDFEALSPCVAVLTK